MKLLFCNKCWDVFKLDLEPRACKCGLVTGQYLEDEHHAITNGKGVSLAIGNGALQMAIRKVIADDKYPKSGDDSIEYHYHVQLGQIEHAWVRPNQGLGNPRQKVVKDGDNDKNKD